MAPRLPSRGDLDFDTLVAQACGESTAGWDFSWLAGRASEERPSWGYVGLLADRLRAARRTLDLDTGGGEVLSEAAATATGQVVAIEAWPDNLPLARARLGPLGTAVVAAEGAALPFADQRFDLVVARHPVETPWREIARVLEPGGRFFSQQVGAGSVRELTWSLMGPRPVGLRRAAATVAAGAEAAGLEVVDLRSESLPMAFNDVGAVVYFLRKVPWIVPDFTVARYEAELRALDARIRREGPFRAHSERFLIEVQRPRP